jgi:hypothetical protein
MSMFDFSTNAFPVLIALLIGAGAMYAYLRARPDGKIAAAKDAARALRELSKELGSDDSEEAKRRANELALQLDKVRDEAAKLPK